MTSPHDSEGTLLSIEKLAAHYGMTVEEWKRRAEIRNRPVIRLDNKLDGSCSKDGYEKATGYGVRWECP